MQKNVTKVPIAITASTEEELTERCLANNILNDTEFEYYEVYKDGDKIVAWFRADITKYKRLP